MAVICIVALPFVGLQCNQRSKLVGTWGANTGCGSVTITLNKDGTGTLTSPMEAKSFKWNLSGDKLNLTVDGETTPLNFKIEGDVLTIIDPKQPNEGLSFHRIR